MKSALVKLHLFFSQSKNSSAENVFPSGRLPATPVQFPRGWILTSSLKLAYFLQRHHVTFTVNWKVNFLLANHDIWCRNPCSPEGEPWWLWLLEVSHWYITRLGLELQEKCLSYFWIARYDIFFRHSCSPEDEFVWLLWSEIFFSSFLPWGWHLQFEGICFRDFYIACYDIWCWHSCSPGGESQWLW